MLDGSFASDIVDADDFFGTIHSAEKIQDHQDSVEKPSTREASAISSGMTAKAFNRKKRNID